MKIGINILLVVGWLVAMIIALLYLVSSAPGYEPGYDQLFGHLALWASVFMCFRYTVILIDRWIDDTN